MNKQSSTHTIKSLAKRNTERYLTKYINYNLIFTPESFDLFRYKRFFREPYKFKTFEPNFRLTTCATNCHKTKKLRKELHCCSSFRSFHFKNGGYLLSHLAGSTIDDVRLNFSVRNGKRWNPDAITTLVFFSFIDRSEKEKKISNQNLFIKKLSGY